MFVEMPVSVFGVTVIQLLGSFCEYEMTKVALKKQVCVALMQLFLHERVVSGVNVLYHSTVFYPQTHNNETLMMLDEMEVVIKWNR